MILWCHRLGKIVLMHFDNVDGISELGSNVSWVMSHQFNLVAVSCDFLMPFWLGKKQIPHDSNNNQSLI